MYFYELTARSLIYANINGTILPEEAATTHLLQLQQNAPTGLLETMLFVDGTIQLSHLHWERLQQGSGVMNLQITSVALIESEVLALVRRNGLMPLCRVRLLVSPVLHSSSVQYTIQCIPISPELPRYNLTGLTIGIAGHLTKPSGPYCNLKTSDLALYQEAASFATEQTWDDALILNESGSVIESSIGNLFVVHGSIISTPPLIDGCVSGVFRKYLLNVLHGLGFTVQETSVTPASLLTADEVFLTNAIRRIKWVQSISTRTYDNTLSSTIHSLLYP